MSGGGGVLLVIGSAYLAYLWATGRLYAALRAMQDPGLLSGGGGETGSAETDPMLDPLPVPAPSPPMTPENTVTVTIPGRGGRSPILVTTTRGKCWGVVYRTARVDGGYHDLEARLIASELCPLYYPAPRSVP